MQDTITHALVPYENATDTMRYSMVLPLAAPRQAADAIAAYEALKAAVVRPDDVQKIQGRDFLKKSFWRRIATCFGLTLDLVSESRGFDESGKLFYSVLYRAVAPNGRSMIGDGYCSTAESGRGNWPEHNVRATAHTRAKNRAISDLVGGGEVSAEELQDYEEHPTQRPTPMKTGYATYTERPQIHTDAEQAIPATTTTTNTKASELQHRISEIETAEWERLDGYRRDLDVTDADYAKAKKTYTTVAEMAAALERLAERKRVEESQVEQMEGEPEVEQQQAPAAGSAEDDISWKSLERRSLAAKTHRTKQEWADLLERTGGSYEDTLALVEQAEAQKGRH